MGDDDRLTVNIRYANPDMLQGDLNKLGLPQPVFTMFDTDVSYGNKSVLGDAQLHISYTDMKYSVDESRFIGFSTEKNEVVNSGTTYQVHAPGFGISTAPLRLLGGDSFRIETEMRNSFLIPISIGPDGKSYGFSVATDLQFSVGGGGGWGGLGVIIGLRSITRLAGSGPSAYLIPTIGITSRWFGNANGQNLKQDTWADRVTYGFGLFVSRAHYLELANIDQGLFDAPELKQKKPLIDLLVAPPHSAMFAGDLDNLAGDKGGRLYGVDSSLAAAGLLLASASGGKWRQMGMDTATIALIDMWSKIPEDPATQGWVRFSSSAACLALTLALPSIMTAAGKDMDREGAATLTGVQTGCTGQMIYSGLRLLKK